MIEVHFINVGQGNMVIAIFPDSQILVYDCNITDENEKAVFNYLYRIMPKRSIDIFVNSHREADHMRGIKKLHRSYPINTLWDSGISGNTEAPEYQEYMDFRRNCQNVYEVTPGQYWQNKPNVRIINGKRATGDINAQSIVLHMNNNGASVLLAGDTDAKVWRDYIMRESSTSIGSSILFASHHGSVTFFDDPRDSQHYYVDHIRAINPTMTVISVGTNPHGHPEKAAIDLYEKYSSGSNQGNKVFRSDYNGTMKLELKDDGSWTLFQKQ